MTPPGTNPPVPSLPRGREAEGKPTPELCAPLLGQARTGQGHPPCCAEPGPRSPTLTAKPRVNVLRTKIRFPRNTILTPQILCPALRPAVLPHR